MLTITAQRLLTASLLGTGLVLSAVPAQAQQTPTSAEETYRDIERTLGSVPSFLKQFPEMGIAGAWQEMKSVQLNPATKLDGKTKELIGLSVAAQITCTYCIYFQTTAAKLNGATDEEIREAVAMAAITRHWSTVLNGMQTDAAAFKTETDSMLERAADKAKSGASGATRP